MGSHSGCSYHVGFENFRSSKSQTSEDESWKSHECQGDPDAVVKDEKCDAYRLGCREEIWVHHRMARHHRSILYHLGRNCSERAHDLCHRGGKIGGRRERYGESTRTWPPHVLRAHDGCVERCLPGGVDSPDPQKSEGALGLSWFV
jgi:hypothetical protein